MKAKEEVKEYLEGEGILMPEVGEGLMEGLEKTGEVMYSTRSDEAPDPYTLSWFLDEIENKDVGDYLIVGYSGHGTNSWAMHYYLKEGAFACFVQKSWGGAYVDEERAREKLNQAIGAINGLREEVKKAVEAQKIKEDEQLIVVESDFDGNKWRWGVKGGGVAKEEDWNREEPTFLYALGSIMEK